MCEKQHIVDYLSKPKELNENIKRSESKAHASIVYVHTHTHSTLHIQCARRIHKIRFGKNLALLFMCNQMTEMELVFCLLLEKIKLFLDNNCYSFNSQRQHKVHSHTHTQAIRPRSQTILTFL